MTRETLAAMLKKLREAAHLSQKELAEKSGVNVRTLQKIEQGTHDTSWVNVEQLADALGVSIEIFRGEAGETEESATPKPGRGRPPKRITSDPLSFAVVGAVSAGPGSYEELDDKLNLGALYEGCVAYEVKGNSMIEDHIQDGDFVIVRPVDDAKTGDVVVAWVADVGVLLKRYDARGYLRSRGKDRWSHKLGEGDRILGVLAGVVRCCRK